MKKNGFTPILIVLVIVVLGVVGYLIYQKNFTKNSIVGVVPNTTTKLAVIQNDFKNVQDITFSKDGRHVAYSVGINGKFVVVLDGKEGKQYDYVQNVVFSPNGEKLVYIASLNNKTFIVLNGEESTRNGDIRNVVFSPDSKLIAYQIIYSPGGYSSLVIGDQEFKNFGNASNDFSQNFAFSQDSKEAAWITETMSPNNKETGNYREVNGTKIYDSYFVTKVNLTNMKTSRLGTDVYDGIYQLIFSPDGERIAYSVSEDGNYYGVDNGKVVSDGAVSILPGNYSNIVLPEYNNVRLTYSPNSQKLAYLIMDTYGNHFLILDGQKSELSDFYGLDTPIVFSPDGKRIAFGVLGKLADGDQYIIDNGSKETSYGGISTPVFSPDSQKLAYVARKGDKEFIVVNGKEIEAPGTVYTSPIFTVDSKMVGYGTKIGNELWWKLVSVE
jgi:Tol biopolymer transport system component